MQKVFNNTILHKNLSFISFKVIFVTIVKLLLKYNSDFSFLKLNNLFLNFYKEMFLFGKMFLKFFFYETQNNYYLNILIPV